MVATTTDYDDRPIGTSLVRSLIASGTIRIDLGERNSTTTTGPVKITLASKEFLITGEGEASKVTETPAFISLGHELIHALRRTEGRVAPFELLVHEFLDPRGRKVAETVLLEELIVSGNFYAGEKG